MTVAAVVVSRTGTRQLERSLPALAPQVDEVVVIANLPGSVGRERFDARVLENERPRSLCGQRQPGRRGDDGRLRPGLESGRLPGARRRRGARPRAKHHPRAGFVGPLVFWPDGTWQPTLRRFPTVLGTIWRRTPLRMLRDPYRHQVSHYGTRPSEPVQGDWLLGGVCLLMRRTMLDEPAAGMPASATTSRTSTSPTAPPGPAGSAGSSRRRSPATTTPR